MAENKYLKAMQQASEHVAKEAEPSLPPQEPLQPEPPRSKPPRSVGRPPGKRSNPEWEQVTVFIRKETKRAALRRMMDDPNRRDLSEVLEHLLAKWSKISQL